MDCPSCAEKIVNSVATLDGVVPVEPQVMTGIVRIECVPEKVGVDAVVERAQAAGYDVESRSDLETVRFDVPTMACAPVRVTSRTHSTPSTASTNERRYRRPAPSSSPMLLSGPLAPISSPPSRAGYEVEESGAEADFDAESSARDVWLSPRALKTWIGGGLLFLGRVFEFLLAGFDVTLFAFLGREFGTAELLYFAGAVISGEEIPRNGYYSARTRSLDIDLLMSLGVTTNALRLARIRLEQIE